MFREIREIRTEEKLKNIEKKVEELSYTRIKPETNMTVNEVKDFWKGVFSNLEG